MDRGLAYRTAVIVSGLALLFVVVACVPPLLFVGTVATAPSSMVNVLVFLWSAFWLPINIVPEFGLFLERTLLLASPTPAIKVAPLLLVIWLVWAVLFFLLLALLRRVRRAS